MKVCVVGSGSIGKRHIKNFVAVCNKYQQKPEIHLLRSSKSPLDKSILKYINKILYRCEDLDQIYDAIFICNPTFKHYETIEKLNAYTRTFFVEKPVVEDCRINIDNICKENIEYYIACPLRYTKILEEARKVIQDEQVYSARAISSSYLPDWRAGIDYRKTYSAHKNMGGGVKIDLIHEWDYLISLFGYPEKVLLLDGKLSNLEIDCEDIAIYIAQYADKLVEIHLDYFGRKTRRTLELRTDRNEYVFDIAENKIYKNGILFANYAEDPNDKYLKEMEYFFQLITRKVKNINNQRHAIKTLKIAQNYI